MAKALRYRKKAKGPQNADDRMQSVHSNESKPLSANDLYEIMNLTEINVLSTEENCLLKYLSPDIILYFLSSSHKLKGSGDPMFIRNKSNSNQHQQIFKNYHRLMKQFRAWEKSNTILEANEECFKTLDIELKTIEKFYNEFTTKVLAPLDQHPTSDLPEFISQEDIFSLLGYRQFMLFAQMFAEREAWMQCIAGTDGKNAHTSESYRKFKSLISKCPGKFVIEESLSHFEQGTLKYHHDWQTAKRQIAKELKSLRALHENWKESSNKKDRERASFLIDFINKFENIPDQLRLREEIRLKQSESYKNALATDKFKAAQLLNKHLYDYDNPQEELAEKMKLLQSLSHCTLLFEHNRSPIGRLKTEFNIKTPASQKLASLEKALSSGENALNLYLKHTMTPAGMTSATPQKSSDRESASLPGVNKTSESISEHQHAGHSNQETQPQINSIPKKNNTGKVFRKVQEYEENLRKLGLFETKTSPLPGSLNNPTPSHENTVSL